MIRTMHKHVTHICTYALNRYLTNYGQFGQLWTKMKRLNTIWSIVDKNEEVEHMSRVDYPPVGRKHSHIEYPS